MLSATIGKSEITFDWEKERPAKPIPGQRDLIYYPVQKEWDQKKVNNADFIAKLLAGAGVQPAILPFVVAQCFFETGGWTNNGFTKYNNASGIKFAGQHNAKMGPSGFALFKTWPDWARAMKHEISKGSNPQGAIDIPDYVARLKQNGYFGAGNEASYRAGVINAYQRLYKIKADLKTNYGNMSSDQVRAAEEQAKEGGGDWDWWKKLKTIEKIGIIAAGTMITMAAVKS